MWHVIHARHRMLAALIASASLNCIARRINHEREGGRREDELTAKQKARHLPYELKTCERM